nr:jerky protein homolog-like [Nomia melanderi]XP_031843599.1 jerky protein homolog-like [Nomia melanderi]
MQDSKRGPVSTTLTIEQKVEILQKLECGASTSTLASEYNIHPSTVRKIRRRGFPSCQGIDMRKRKRIRKPVYDALDTKLYLWFLETKTLGIPITDLLLQEKALQISQEIGGSSTFKASHGWLWKFKNRHNIRLLNAFREKGSADATAAEKFTDEFHSRIEEEGLQWCNIYNMDETGLIWKALPAKTPHSVKGKFEGKKLKKDRVIVGLCANATGTHKLKPLVINKFKNPRALKHCKDQMPVVLKSQRRGWIDQTTFSNWYENDFKSAVRKYQLENGVQEKAVLLLDNCWGHKLLMAEYHYDDQFEIVFLPPNTTSLLQPMGQGVIAKIKKLFRHKMLSRIIACGGGLNEFYSKYTIKDCIQLLDESWTEINSRNIRNSWNNIKKSSEEVIVKEELDEQDKQLHQLIDTLAGNDEYMHNFISAITEADTNLSEEEVEEGLESYPEEEQEEEEEQGREEEQQFKYEEEEQELIGNEDEQLEQEGGKDEQEEQEYEQTEEEEEEEEGDQSGTNKGDNKWDSKLELAQAFEILNRHAETKPKYVKTLLLGLKQAFMREET